ncbi:MAG: glycosyltransferase family 2 protein [Deltaproteobacteria bacterium]|nr:glycosyltransferase family 2 protein [Deltaproteobacteria bacterium]
MSRLVSVIIPAYQAERWITQAVASCLAQSHRELEVLVLDDGSTDRTPELVTRIADSRVRLVRSEVNEGLDVVHNRGLALSHGDLVARLDADDLMLPWRLELQVAHLDAHPELGLVGMNAIVLEPGRLARLYYRFTGRALHWVLHLHCALLHPTVTLRRAALPPGGYPTGTRYSHDWALFLRMGRTSRLDTLARPGILYRRHAGAVGVAALSAQAASARRVFGRYLREAFGLSLREDTIGAWLEPQTASAAEDPAEVAALARLCRPDALDLGPAAPPWDDAGLARARRLWLYRIARMLRSSASRGALWRHLLPLAGGGLARLAIRG